MSLRQEPSSYTTICLIYLTITILRFLFDNQHRFSLPYDFTHKTTIDRHASHNSQSSTPPSHTLPTSKRHEEVLFRWQLLDVFGAWPGSGEWNWLPLHTRHLTLATHLRRRHHIFPWRRQNRNKYIDVAMVVFRCATRGITEYGGTDNAWIMMCLTNKRQYTGYIYIYMAKGKSVRCYLNQRMVICLNHAKQGERPRKVYGGSWYDRESKRTNEEICQVVFFSVMCAMGKAGLCCEYIGKELATWLAVWHHKAHNSYSNCAISCLAEAANAYCLHLFYVSFVSIWNIKPTNNHQQRRISRIVVDDDTTIRCATNTSSLQRARLPRGCSL